MKLTTPSSRPTKGSKKSIDKLPIPEMTSGPMDSPSAQDVALRAYYTYQNQGCGDGYDLDHWYAAEADLKPGNANLKE
jgi:hypothetical protein